MTVLDWPPMQSPSEFLEQLATARHESQIVIAINVDIRGFSRFSLEVESVEASIFIKKFYDRLLSTYFTDPAFFKPTGDGMLMIFPVEESELEERTNGLVEQSLRLLEDFPRMFEEIPIINFPVPTGVGIGMARGAASRLVAGDIVLDYSGKVLNLASRLMDMARPSGMLLDGTIGFQLLRPELAERFEPDDIYVKSVAERKAITVRLTKGLTTIPESAHHPIDRLRWHEQVKAWTCGEACEKADVPVWIALEHEVDDEDSIEVAVSFPGTPDKTRLNEWFTPPFQARRRGGRPAVVVDTRSVARRLLDEGVDRDATIKFEVSYPIGEAPRK
jgi:class 3 adenylate cyclase